MLQASLFDSKDCDVNLTIHSYQLCFEEPRGRLIAAERWKPDLDKPGAPHHVSISNDVSVLGHNHARTGAVLLRQQTGSSSIVFFGGCITGRKNLNHCGTDAGHPHFERRAEIVERERRRATLVRLSGLGGWCGGLSLKKGSFQQCDDNEQHQFHHNSIFSHNRACSFDVTYSKGLVDGAVGAVLVSNLSAREV